MKTCPEVTDVLSPYLDGELSADESQQIREHLSECPSCTEELGRLERMELLIHTSLEADRSVPRPEPDYLARVHERVQDDRRSSLRILAWAACLMVAVAGAFVYFMGTRPQKPAAVSVRQFLIRYTEAAESSRPSMLKEEGRWHDGDLKILVSALDDPSLKIQAAAREILQAMPNPEKIHELVHGSGVLPPVTEFPEESFQPLGKDPSDLEAISSLLKQCLEQDSGQELAQKALTTIAASHRTIITDHLIPLLKSEDPVVVQKSLEILRHSRSRVKVSHLIDLLDAPHLAGHARRVLREIAHKYAHEAVDFEFDAVRWSKWYRNQKWVEPETDPF